MPDKIEIKIGDTPMNSYIKINDKKIRCRKAVITLSADELVKIDLEVIGVPWGELPESDERLTVTPLVGYVLTEEQMKEYDSLKKLADRISSPPRRIDS